MKHISTTPFGRRAISAAQLAGQTLVNAPAPCPDADKWEVFRALTSAREFFNLGDRALSVLNALLTFHPHRSLSDTDSLIVFPSNKSLADRAHGMAESTLRRHLATLVERGLIARHDSPNGKRYARRCQGTIETAFGFNLRPLLARSSEIFQSAKNAEAEAAQLASVRERISLAIRDGAKLTAYGKDTTGGVWENEEARGRTLAKALRRKLDLATARSLLAAALVHLRGLNARLSHVATPSAPTSETSNVVVNDNQNERHIQRSKPDNFDNMDYEEKAPELQHVPLQHVLIACCDIRPYGSIRTWSDLIETAGKISKMMGISRTAWNDAIEVMSPVSAATTVAIILQRIDKISCPGGYLRRLTTLARQGKFEPESLVRSML